MLKKISILEKTEVNRSGETVIRTDMTFLDDIETKEVFVEKNVEDQSGIKLEEADVVIAAGMGVRTDRAWSNLQQIAAKLGGAVAWSRNFVDSGKVNSESNMIGTSGKSVKPSVFIGAGISGATHFVCGIAKSKLIINVNTDENAKIFSHSDYGVVGDSEKFLSALLARLNG